MKKILLSFVATLLFAHLSAQSWQPLIGGNLNGQVTAIISYNGLLWVGGDFTQAGPLSVGHVVRYDGSAWIATASLPNAPESFCVYNNELYALGGFDFGALRYGLMKWDGTNWQCVSKINSGGTVYSADVFNGELIIGGCFTMIDNIPIGYLVRYNGTSYFGFPGTITCQWLPQPIIRRVVTLAGWVYIGGEFDQIFGTTTFGAVKWNGPSWWALSTTPQFFVSDFVLVQGKVYCVGNFPILNQTTSQAVLREGNSGWQAVGIGARMAVLDCEEYENKLYVGGESVPYGAGVRLGDCGFWDGSGWSADTVRIWANHEEIVTCLYNDRSTGILYAGGNFNVASGDAVNYIASKVPVVLPVALTYFTSDYKDDRAMITWQTMSEVNADYFAVAISTDGYTYADIATVQAQGNTTQVTNYSTDYVLHDEYLPQHNDLEQDKETIYFRLKQYDWDGVCSGTWYCALKITLSGSIEYSSQEEIIVCQNCRKELQIYSSTGQLIDHGFAPISVAKYIPGIYFVVSGEEEVLRFVIPNKK